MKLVVNESKSYVMASYKTFILLCLVILTSSTNQSFSQTQYTPIKQINCFEKSNAFYLFYEGESLPFNYEKIGEVSSIANGISFTDEHLLNELKFYAWSNCANGLLFIKNGFIGAESQRYYTAVAVRIEIDPDFVMKYGSGTDMTFIQQFERKQAMLQRQQKAGMGLTFVGILLLIFLLTQLQFD